MTYNPPLTTLTKAEKIAANNYRLPFGYISDSNVRKYIDSYTKINKTTNWNQMSMSTAQGAAALDIAYSGASFDGRYIYYVPLFSDTFVRVQAMYSDYSCRKR